MELETGHPICSLCRRELSNLSFEVGLEAKLCEACRGLIQTALHGSDSRAAAASSSPQPSAAVAYAQSNDVPVVNVEERPQAFFADLPAFGNAAALANHTELFNVNEGSFEMQFDDEPEGTPEGTHDTESRSFAASMLETEHYTDLQEDSYVEAASPSYEMHFDHDPVELLAEKRTPGMHEAGFAEHPEPDILASAPSDQIAHTELAADLSELHHSIVDSNNSSESGLIGEHTYGASALEASEDQESEQQQPTATESAQSHADGGNTDPWEEPLPAWDYSRNEYPVLMGPPRGGSFSKFKIPVAVFLILALAAGFYYLIYPQLSRDQSPAIVVPSQPATETHSATAASKEAVAQNATPSTPAETPVSTANTEAKPTQQTNPQAPGAEGSTNSQGRFSLQAAAFPTQAGADEFAEKLKHAGVPSYVVAADIAHKGRWFRVRVGRFNTADEAQRFAAEAQSRAKASGMSLQLMVSQYDQP